LAIESRSQYRKGQPIASIHSQFLQRDIQTKKHQNECNPKDRQSHRGSDPNHSCHRPLSHHLSSCQADCAGDAVATAKPITASAWVFRLGLASDSIVCLIEIGLCALLYVLLNPVNKTLSLVAAFARLTMTLMQGINLLNPFLFCCF
jgi:hypothetical protein